MSSRSGLIRNAADADADSQDALPAAGADCDRRDRMRFPRCRARKRRRRPRPPRQRRPQRAEPNRRSRRRAAEAGHAGRRPRAAARPGHPRVDLPDDRIRGEGARSAAGILRPRDLAGEPVSARRDRAADARRGSRAQGIAQFMPGTASERRLLDPFDPVQALPKSAEFLAELRGQFGNLGLAAAAYNAGPRRVQEWIAGTGSLPSETRNYVYAITGTSADDWAAIGDKAKPPPPVPATGCRELMALLQRAPNAFVSELGAAGEARRRPALGRAARRRLQSRSRADELRPGDDSAARGDRRARSESARLGVPQPRHPARSIRCGSAPRRGSRPTNSAIRIRRAGSACLVLRNGGRG